MQTIAILAPPLVGVPADKCERAHLAMMQQMMLIARGFPVDHPAVRSAAAIVGSALAPDPIEFELAEPTVTSACQPSQSGTRPALNEAYGRYLRTILTTQPASTA